MGFFLFFSALVLMIPFVQVSFASGIQDYSIWVLGIVIVILSLLISFDTNTPSRTTSTRENSKTERNFRHRIEEEWNNDDV